MVIVLAVSYCGQGPLQEIHVASFFYKGGWVYSASDALRRLPRSPDSRHNILGGFCDSSVYGKGLLLPKNFRDRLSVTVRCRRDGTPPRPRGS